MGVLWILIGHSFYRIKLKTFLATVFPFSYSSDPFLYVKKIYKKEGKSWKEILKRIPQEIELWDLSFSLE